MNAKIKIIYIAGYGFSGSTLLERMIATHPQIVGCGEVYNLLHDFHINETCSCGSALPYCPHWKEVHAIYLKTKKNIDNLNVFSAMADNKNLDTLYFSDSSKTTFGNMMRPYLLAKKYDLSLIHLSRNGIDCLQSVLKRNPQSASLLKSFTVAIHWSIANLAAYAFKFFNPSAYYKVSYENLIKNPNKHINGIHDFLNLDSQSHLETFHQNYKIPRTHQLSGNAIRRSENLVLKTTSENKKKRTDLPSMIFKLVSFPVLKLMGY